MLKDPENTVWVGLEYFCDEGDRYWNMSDEEFTEFAINELCKIGIIEKEDVLDSVRLKVKKAYPAYFGTYKDFDKVREYLDSVENLYCIGRNGQHRYNNLDHSMCTSFEAVKNILSGEKDKSNVWSVNTEKEYHEEKKQ
jgi:protoporphyrinogen oxidase